MYGLGKVRFWSIPPLFHNAWLDCNLNLIKFELQSLENDETDGVAPKCDGWKEDEHTLNFPQVRCPQLWDDLVKAGYCSCVAPAICIASHPIGLSDHASFRVASIEQIKAFEHACIASIRPFLCWQQVLRLIQRRSRLDYQKSCECLPFPTVQSYSHDPMSYPSLPSPAGRTSLVYRPARTCGEKSSSTERATSVSLSAEGITALRRKRRRRIL
jgi:hypothetical protein